MPRLWEKIEFSVLAAGIAIAGCFWVFVELSQVARDASPHAFDTRILLFFRESGDTANPIGPPWLDAAVRDTTSLGSMAILVLITTATILYLLLISRRLEALMVLVAVGGGQVLSSLLKLGIDRPRPDLVPHLVDVQTLSFPSGHAMLSAVTYLTLGSLLSSIVPGRVTKYYVLAVAVLITLLVGVSRIYLGVHWPSDVLAGWCAGFAWALACWLASRLLLRRSSELGPEDAKPQAQR